MSQNFQVFKENLRNLFIYPIVYIYFYDDALKHPLDKTPAHGWDKSSSLVNFRFSRVAKKSSCIFKRMFCLTRVRQKLLLYLQEDVLSTRWRHITRLKNIIFEYSKPVFLNLCVSQPVCRSNFASVPREIFKMYFIANFSCKSVFSLILVCREKIFELKSVPRKNFEQKSLRNTVLNWFFWQK